MTFFNDWPLWVKMVFVLGIAIVFTLIAGIIKLAYDHTQLRKFARIEKERLEEQPMVEEFARQRRGRQDIPFGVRAIQSGIEVEGVWISRTNSPASSAPASPLLSPQVKGKTASRSSEVLSPQHPEQTQQRSGSPSGSSVGSFERATSAERLESVSALDLPSTSRPTYQPRQPSALRFSTADELETGQLPAPSVSDSSKSSSEESGSSGLHPSTAYQQVREPNYYRPSGSGYAGSGPPSPALVRPEYVQPGRSSRNSNTPHSYSYAPAEQYQTPSTPQRFHGTSYSQVNNSDSFSGMHAPNDRSYAESQASQRNSRLESIELTDNPSMTDLSPEKAKRSTRKLQKKQTK